MGIIAEVVAFAAGCIVSAKFWAGIVIGPVAWPQVKRAVAAAASWVSEKIGF